MRVHRLSVELCRTPFKLHDWLLRQSAMLPGSIADWQNPCSASVPFTVQRRTKLSFRIKRFFSASPWRPTLHVPFSESSVLRSTVCDIRRAGRIFVWPFTHHYTHLHVPTGAHSETLYPNRQGLLPKDHTPGQGLLPLHNNSVPQRKFCSSTAKEESAAPISA